MVFFCTERIVTGVLSGAIDVTSFVRSDAFITAFYMRAALGFLADLDTLMCCIHYILMHFHYFPHNYCSDIHDSSFAKRKYLEIFFKEIELCTVKSRKIELRFFKISTNSK